ncbi:conserved hypothetical protein [Talaromyces stipitatus ATCC 10500]|uniref:Cx9C motif-containing protein 4, mitochondrial n=1 Tax=Talaromyces stipitatus (strain ATCC 10500 / CBS 375.48 / QM 6759 / NRRL 1006) TaxID=441959 RepID=B8LVL3_TALSN|nr:uncharacterized protein TSTA_075170 [Talaromyces stipitatus ATCC 10500]EED24143.1 conserved hypothetical protein [Talaromyces stipitatus ATCC 10500]
MILLMTLHVTLVLVPSRVSPLHLVPATSTDELPACLTKNSYNEEKCQAQIDALYECCNAFYQQRGEDAKTPSCPNASLLRVKMRQRAQQLR